MGCFQSTAKKQFPGHEDPVVLASQTACELFIDLSSIVILMCAFDLIQFELASELRGL